VKLPYQVIVDHPSLGEQDLYIHGLGTFQNGTTTEVSDEQVQHYQAVHSIVESTFDPETGAETRTGKPGAHPADQEIFGVRVVRMSTGSSDEGVNQ